MNSIIGIIAASTAPYLPIDEQKELAEQQLAGVSTEAGSFFSQNAGWLSFVGFVILLVAIAMIIIIGRYRRRDHEYEYQDDPLFAEGEEETSSGGLEEVSEEEEIGPSPFVQMKNTREDYRDSYIGQQEARNEVEFMKTPDDDRAEKTEDSVVDVIPDDHDEEGAERSADHPNVVPLRSTDSEVDPHQGTLDDDQEEEQMPRYAFATSKSQSVTVETVDDSQRDHDESSHGASMSGEERDRPYVAPFIRDDIERSERRQSERVDQLRDDFSAQFDTLKSEQSSRLDLMIAAIDRKLDSLDRQRNERPTLSHPQPTVPDETRKQVSTLAEQVERVSGSIENQSQRIRAITQILENKLGEVSRVYEELKIVHQEVKSTRSDLGRTGESMSSIHAELDGVKEHVGRLERAILDRAAQDSSTTIRLADVVRGTLPEGSYDFGATLSNGEVADCLIRFEGLRHRIAVDGGFPMEAFHELPSRDAVRRNMPQAKAAEDGFRRAILRSILEAADRCISPGDTTDSCLLFLPSEAAYTILHDRFPDLVRDSQRARVWLVSPSTLMGTLQLIRNLLPDQEDLVRREEEMSQFLAQRQEDEKLREEVALLRERSASLAEELERTRGTLRGLIGPSVLEPERAQNSTVGTMERCDDDKHSDVSGWSEPPYRSSAAAKDHSKDSTTEKDTDDTGVIESLSFEGTPEWQSPISRDADRDHGRSYDADWQDPARR